MTNPTNNQWFELGLKRELADTYTTADLLAAAGKIIHQANMLNAIEPKDLAVVIDQTNALTGAVACQQAIIALHLLECQQVAPDHRKSP